MSTRRSPALAGRPSRAQKGDAEPGHRALSQGVTTKIMALADALGNLTDFRLLSGQAHDLGGTAALIEGLSCEKLLADRAFDADWLRKALTGAGIEPVILPKSNRRFSAESDRETYKWRHLSENFFGKLKKYRDIAMRCCKTDESFSAFIALAATVIWLR
jgi:transposase